MNVYRIKIKIPKYVKHILHILESAGFEAFIVGGCVRDSFLGLVPKDWDITTNATPSQVQAIFATPMLRVQFYVFPIALQHGTLGIKPNCTKQIVEITTYRIDGIYTDLRKPDNVAFTQSLYEDLQRRDISINALACRLARQDEDSVSFFDTTKHNITHFFNISYHDTKLTTKSCKLDSIKQESMQNFAFTNPISQGNHNIPQNSPSHILNNTNLQDSIHHNTKSQNTDISCLQVSLQQDTCNEDSIKKRECVELELYDNKSDEFCNCFMQTYDYFDSLKHLYTQTIVCVGKAYSRLSEDLLRILRCIRFASTLPMQFQIQSQTQNALFILAPKLTYIAKERIQSELCKMLLGEYASKVLLQYQSILFSIIPEIEILFLQQYHFNCKALQYAPKNLIIRLAILFNPFPYNTLHYKKYSLQNHLLQCEKALKSLHFDNKTLRNTLALLKIPMTLPQNRIQLKIQLFCYQKDNVLQWFKLFLSCYYAINENIEYEKDSYFTTKNFFLQLQKYYKNIQHTIIQDAPIFLQQYLHTFYDNDANYQLLDIQAMQEILETIIQNNECCSIKQLMLNGVEIQTISQQSHYRIQNKEIGNILRFLTYAVMIGQCDNTKESLEKFLHHYFT